MFYLRAMVIGVMLFSVWYARTGHVYKPVPVRVVMR